MTLILSPFSWLLNLLNGMFFNYGIAIMVFAIFVKIFLFPVSLKGKRGMIQMNMISGEMAKIKQQYGKDPARYNQEVQDLYIREKVNPLGGCLWTLVPLFVLLPLYAIIREPVEYILGLSEIQVYELANALNWDVLAVEANITTVEAVEKALSKNMGNLIESGFANEMYNQLHLAAMIPEGGLHLADGTFVAQMNFHLFGIDLTKTPNWRIWQDMSLQNIGTLILVMISAGSGFVFSQVTQRTNKMNTNQPRNAQMEQTNRTMMYTMPLISIWIGMIMPSIMVVYWISNNLLSMVQEILAGKVLKKDYEAARLASEKRALELKEEEKRQKEAKVKEIERRKEEQAQNKGKNKKKKKVKAVDDKTAKLDRDSSREGMRTYARGRAYDPDRYPDPNSSNGEKSKDDSIGGTKGKNFEEIEESVKTKLEAVEIPEEEETTWENLLGDKEDSEESPKKNPSRGELPEHESTASDEEKEDWEAQKEKLKNKKTENNKES